MMLDLHAMYATKTHTLMIIFNTLYTVMFTNRALSSATMQCLQTVQ